VKHILLHISCSWAITVRFLRFCETHFTTAISPFFGEYVHGKDKNLSMYIPISCCRMAVYRRMRRRWRMRSPRVESTNCLAESKTYMHVYIYTHIYMGVQIYMKVRSVWRMRSPRIASTKSLAESQTYLCMYLYISVYAYKYIHVWIYVLCGKSLT